MCPTESLTRLRCRDRFTFIARIQPQAGHGRDLLGSQNAIGTPDMRHLNLMRRGRQSRSYRGRHESTTSRRLRGAGHSSGKLRSVQLCQRFFRP